MELGAEGESCRRFLSDAKRYEGGREGRYELWEKFKKSLCISRFINERPFERKGFLKTRGRRHLPWIVGARGFGEVP